MMQTIAKPVILVVDDTPENLLLMNELLRDEYKVKGANSGAKALQLAQTAPIPDLILLDIMMPEMDGYEVCTRLKAEPKTQDIPVIFVTACSETEDEEHGLACGAVDYLSKPISPPIVCARIRTHLALKASKDFLRDKNDYLEHEVAKRTAEVVKRTEELQHIQDVTIIAMASLAETRDNETGNHIRRTQHYIRRLAQEVRSHPRFTAALDDKTIDLLFKCAPLHDIGKVGIPDSILLKPGRLTPEEFEIMKQHARLGKEAIEHAEQQLGYEVDFLHLAKEIAYAHHEKWDGSGYPQGLAGESIPLSARLMAVADVYDALISRRVYKPPMPQAEAVQIIQEGRAKAFDPDIVDAFLAIQDEFLAIAESYADKPEDLNRGIMALNSAMQNQNQH